MEEMNSLREKFLPYGKFRLEYTSENSLWICTFELVGNEPFSFQKTNLLDVLDELESVINRFKRNYMPSYVR